MENLSADLAGRLFRFMKIAKIVSSNSHISYVGRVLEERDGAGIPAADDYSFGRFVSMDRGDEQVIGVICDSRLVNPEYSNFSPRLAQMPALGELKRDLFNEQKALIGILLLGSIAGGAAMQQIPRRVVPAGQMVEALDAGDVAKFHRTADGTLQMHYFSNLMSQAGSLAVPLAKTIIDQLNPHCSEAERLKLDVMTGSLSWKHTFGENRF